MTDIIEMARRAGLAAYPDEIEAFAKLVAEECVLAVEGERLVDDAGHPEDVGYNRAIGHAVDAIRAKFNIKGE